MVYKYTQTCPTFFGDGAINKVPELIAEFGAKKVFICSDPGVRKAGIADKCADILKAAGLDVYISTGVTEDPKDFEVHAVSKEMVDYGAEAVVALGGGSAIDCAKAAVIMTVPENAAKGLEYWYYTAGHVAEQKRGVPLIAVPTNSGTGSENTAFAVITYSGPDDPDVGKNGCKKVNLYPADYAVYDPELTWTCPPAATAASGLDALAHAAEAITCTEAVCNPKSDVLGEAAIKIIMKWLPIAVAEPQNREARWQMALGANLAGQAFNDTCCNYAHAFSQCLGAAFHVTHGISCAWGLPECMRYDATQCPERVAKVAKALGIEGVDDMTPEVLGVTVADFLRGYMREWKVKSPKDWGLSREQVVSIADMMLNDNCYVCIPGDKLPTKEEVEEWLGAVYDTYM